MAQFNTVGFDDVEKALLRREKEAIEAVPEMLKVGANVLIRAQKAEIERMRIVDTADMMNSVKATPVKGNDVEQYVEVYPHGKDRKGVRNAEKAFIAQYGRAYGKQKKEARPWLTVANEKCTGEVHDAMRAVWRGKAK